MQETTRLVSMVVECSVELYTYLDKVLSAVKIHGK